MSIVKSVTKNRVRMILVMDAIVHRYFYDAAR